MFESSSKNRKSWNGRQMVWQWIPNTWSNRWKWFGGCHGGFTWRNAYWERRRRAECSRWHISWDERWKIGWLLRLEHSESNRGNFETNSVANRKPMQIRENRHNVAEPRFLCDNSSKSILKSSKPTVFFQLEHLGIGKVTPMPNFKGTYPDSRIKLGDYGLNVLQWDHQNQLLCQF